MCVPFLAHLLRNSQKWDVGFVETYFIFFFFKDKTILLNRDILTVVLQLKIRSSIKQQVCGYPSSFSLLRGYICPGYTNFKAIEASLFDATFVQFVQ